MSNLVVVEEVTTTVVVPELASTVSVEEVGTTVVVQETSPADIVEVVAVGPQGASGTLAIGSVTTGAAGSSASITNVGTSTDAVLNIVIPKGDTGDLTPQLVQAKEDAQAAAAASEVSRLASASSASSANTSAVLAAGSASNAATQATAAANSASSILGAEATTVAKAAEASTSATNAAASASTATTKASEAATSATNAATSASGAATSATSASTSATSASGSAATATTKATDATTQAANALTSANAAAGSATAASTSATSASGSATTATTKAAEAATSATNAAASSAVATNKATEALASATNSANSATAANSSATSASTSAGTATSKATEAQTSATGAATSAATATTKATEAATSATNAATSATGAGTSATSAAGSASAASTSATSASTSAATATTQAGIATTKASEAATSATNAAGSASTATTKASEAATSASGAAISAATATTKASEALTSAGNAATSASQAATSATNAADSATAADASEAAAATSATGAAASATSAATDAATATTKASQATTSASSASTFASTATTKASEAATSATAAAGSATSAANSATTASAQATGALNSATAAQAAAATATTKATDAGVSATDAAASAASATTQATAAFGSATAAAGSATTAGTQASTATTKAGEAATSATNAAASATTATTKASEAAASASAAAAAKSAAETARDQTLSAFDSFDDRYLGQKASDPTVDNDGNALVAGAIYFNTGAIGSGGGMKVYDGTAWLVAYASLAGTLLKASNLSDLNDAAAARTNLGLGSVENKSSATIRAELTSSNVTTALGFTPYNAASLSGALAPYLTSASAASTYQTALVSGTSIRTVNGQSVLGSGNIQIDGGVTSFNTRTGAITLSSTDVTGALGYTPYNATNPSGYITGSALTPYMLAYNGASTANYDTLTTNGVWRNQGGTNGPAGNTHTTLITALQNDGNYGYQLSSSGTALYVRDKSSVWASWRTLIDSGNYNSYAPTLTGSGASGTWSINVTGSAGSVAWSGVTGKPTTIAGYGITDAVSTSSLSSYLPISAGFTSWFTNDANGYWRISASGASAQLGLFRSGSSVGGAYIGADDTYFRVYDSALTDRLRLPLAGGALVVNGNTVLDAGNYTSYAFKAEGTINSDIDADRGQGVVTFDPVPTGTPPLSSPNIRTLNIGNSFIRRTQLAFNYATDQAWFRRRNDGGWNSWREFIHSGNYSSYALPLSGGTLTGRLTSTASASADNYAGVFRIAPSSADQWGGIAFPDTNAGTSNANNFWFYGRGSAVADRTLTAHIPSYSDYSSTGAVPSWGVYTTGATPLFRVWSNGNVAVGASTNYVLHAGNYSSYALPLGGGTVTGLVTFTRDAGSQGWSNIVIDASPAANGSYIRANRASSGSGEVGFAWGNGGSNQWINYMPTNSTTLQWYQGSSVVMSLTTGGALNATTITQANNQVLHAGNYTSYSPSLTGSGASGTWGINVNGTAGSVIIDNSITWGRSGLQFVQVSSQGGTNPALTQAPDNNWWHIIRANHGNSAGYYTDLALPFTSDGGVQYRRISNGGNNGWYLLLDSHNYQSYALPLSGGTLSGYLQAGTAATYDNPGGWGANLVASGTYHARVRVKGTSYNSSGDNEAYLWVDNTVSPRSGLYSSTAFNMNVAGGLYESGSRVLNSSNYTSYSPSLGGSGASGTWGISITGNAASVSGITAGQFFNNMGNNHSTYADFNSVPGFGAYYMQGPTNGPTGIAGNQFYGFTLGLGNEYALSSYASQLYWPRRAQNGSTYIYIRDREGGSWTSWTKVQAGYADSAGSVSGGLTTSNYSSYALPLSGGTLSGGLTVNNATVNVPSGYVSNSNPWGTSNSAFFPNGITTAGNDNWIYGNTYLGNAPGNGSGAQVSSNGRLYIQVSSGTAMHVVRTGSAGNATNAYTALFENSYGDHSWGIVGEFRAGGSGGSDRPSILFSNGYNSTTWSVGFGYYDDQFRIRQNHGHRNGDWGTERFRIDTGGTPYFNGNVALHAGNYTGYEYTRLANVNSNPDNSHPGYGIRPFYSWNIGQANNASAGFANGFSVGSHPNDPNYGFQIVQNMWDEQLYFRRYDYGWKSWRTALDNSNYSSYAVPLSGGTMSGRLSISPGWTTSGRNYSNDWIEFGNYSGLYSPNNGAHFYPNNASYGGWRSAGSRNGWGGLEFDANNGNVCLMVNPSSNTVGFHNPSYGWYFLWEAGILYCNKNNYGGGGQAVVLDSYNYSNYAIGRGGDTIDGIIYFRSNFGDGGYVGSNTSYRLQAYSTDGHAAGMSFHRSGRYAVNMGLDPDNVIRIGGWSASANRLQMDMSGNLTMAGNVTAYSDERLKKDWAPVQSGFVEALASIKSGTYTRIDSDERQAGVSAQDFQKILPETISTDNEGTLSLAYGNAALVSAVELAKKIVEQEKRIAHLESLISKLIGD